MNHIQDQNNNSRSGHDADFDESMRALHAQSLAHVSSPALMRLRAARSAASLARAPTRGFGWVLASGFAALFALVIGLQLRGPSPVASTATQQFAGLSTNFDTDNAVSALDENPDFYLWLASNSDAMPTPTER